MTKDLGQLGDHAGEQRRVLGAVHGRRRARGGSEYGARGELARGEWVLPTAVLSFVHSLPGGASEKSNRPLRVGLSERDSCWYRYSVPYHVFSIVRHSKYPPLPCAFRMEHERLATHNALRATTGRNFFPKIQQDRFEKRMTSGMCRRAGRR